MNSRYFSKKQKLTKLASAKTILLVFIVFAFCFQLSAQKKDSIDYRQIGFLKLNQANDLYTIWYQSDKYYTDGIDIEVAHRIFNNKVADAVLLGFKNTPYKDFSLSINQDIYTPENTELVEVDTTDRPYAGQLFFTYAKYSNQFWKGKKLISKFYIGVQGPAALAEEMQNGVHSLINNLEVKGWHNQLSNGLLLDYELEYMQLIPVSSPITELHYFGKIRLGTVNSLLEAGLRFKLGRYTDSYMNFYGIFNPKYQHNFTADDVVKMSANRRKILSKKYRDLSLEKQAEFLSKKLNRKLQFYFFVEPSATFLLRDGSVEGSLIQFSPNVYEMSYADYNHYYLGGRYGVVLQYSHFLMEFSRYLNTDEFRGNGYFGYGRLILTWVF